MTLQEVIRAIEEVAGLQPSVNMIVRNDVFRINEKPDARYGAFAWTQGQHSSELESSWRKYNFSFFYVDRLTASKENETEIQSVGISTLENILGQLEESRLYVSSANYTPFNQRFADECAGVFCSVTIEAQKNSICPEIFSGSYLRTVSGDLFLDVNERKILVR